MQPNESKKGDHYEECKQYFPDCLCLKCANDYTDCCYEHRELRPTNDCFMTQCHDFVPDNEQECSEWLSPAKPDAIAWRECSVCGAEVEGIAFPFCPYCGRKAKNGVAVPNE